MFHTRWRAVVLNIGMPNIPVVNHSRADFQYTSTTLSVTVLFIQQL